jgi:hypothetical protein
MATCAHCQGIYYAASPAGPAEVCNCGRCCSGPVCRCQSEEDPRTAAEVHAETELELRREWSQQ